MAVGAETGGDSGGVHGSAVLDGEKEERRQKAVEAMKKNDLKSGMIAETRNGKFITALVTERHGLIFIALDGWYDGADYNDDLISNTGHKCDIVAVYQPTEKHAYQPGGNEISPMKLLWKRNEKCVAVSIRIEFQRVAETFNLHLTPDEAEKLILQYQNPKR